MDYVALHFNIKADEPFKQTAREILIAELGEAGFESFVETEEGVTAYIQKKDWQDSILNDIQILDAEAVVIDYRKEEIEQVNWNAEWEKHFDPIEVEGKVYIRAPFHPSKNFGYEIVIEPKMSFGTGHHETTYLMISQLLKMNLKGKTILDMGTGTGVLAILAEKMDAEKIDAIDNDRWSYENALENVQRNKCNRITVIEGDASLLGKTDYDVILANINRNILLQDMECYTAVLKKPGILILSGFYTEDIPVIEARAKDNGLNPEVKMERNNWVSLKFVTLP